MTVSIRAFILLAFIGAVKSQKAGKPTFLAKQDGTNDPISGTVNPTTRTCGKNITLKCTAASGGTATTTHMKFTQNGNNLAGKTWEKVTANDEITYTLSQPLTAKHYGKYHCFAATGYTAGKPTGVSDPSDDYVTIDCKSCDVGTDGNKTCTGNPAIGAHSYCKSGECDCEYDGSVENGCEECKTAAHCKDQAKGQCNSNGECVACLGGTSSKPDNPGCNPDSTAPRCNTDGGNNPVCTGCDDNAFCKSISASKPVCDTKAGNCKAETSSAASVTSTACMVIASLIVAMIN